MQTLLLFLLFLINWFQLLRWGWCSAEMVHYIIDNNAIQTINDARIPVLIFQSLAFIEVF